jgi:predicted O-methyltransferase YrrM
MKKSMTFITSCTNNYYEFCTIVSDNIISGTLIIIDNFFNVTNASPNDENTTSAKHELYFPKNGAGMS